MSDEPAMIGWGPRIHITRDVLFGRVITVCWHWRGVHHILVEFSAR